MARRRPLRTLADEDDVLAGRVRVDGVVVTNPDSMVLPSASIVVAEVQPLRGVAKLGAALDGFALSVAGRVALDAGASTGGFVTALLERGAARVYAVEVGHGQLLGSLRQDARVVNLESTNLADLNTSLVPGTVEIVTLDLSYLSLAEALPQLDRISLAPGPDLVALVKPMFELKLPDAPTATDRRLLDMALTAAVTGVELAGWVVEATMDSPVAGSKGAAELWIHARR